MSPSKCHARGLGLEFLILAAAAALLAVPAVAQTVTGSIQGTVSVTGTSKPVSGAIVTAIRNGLPPQSQAATSSANGSFQFSGLPAATYRLCVQVPAGGYLNPCTWTINPPSVTLASGKSASGVQISITAGSVLSVQINDPANLLAQIGKSGQVPPVSMGVHTSAGLFEPLTMRSANAAGSEHEVTIPFDTAVPVWVHSAKVTLTQSGGAAVPATGLSVAVTHPSAAAVAAPQLVFQITGVKP